MKISRSRDWEGKNMYFFGYLSNKEWQTLPSGNSVIPSWDCGESLEYKITPYYGQHYDDTFIKRTQENAPLLCFSYLAEEYITPLFIDSP
jgi:hypothetical protein